MNALMKYIFSTRFGLAIAFVAIIWAVEIVNLFMGHGLSRFGILPRTAQGLMGIGLAPFLHAGPIHAALNTAPLFILGAFVSLRGVRTYLAVSVIVILLSGGAVWLFGRPSYHLGASSLVFGYFGFLVARGWYERSFLSLAVAAITILLYGGIIWGILPVRSYISWEGHLFGLIAGIIAARILSGMKFGR
uniref:Rhomboid family protein n=1 Tax=Candidatus Kentrum sp. SD TaxID=2126332 RepID=A0A450Z1A5_9GAMM|nr:MAG: Rhomboid family protein [Candidatus Kentron sp. SD]VFK47528.1 MAG: Rhomboid family protein [Candidatus Kentron sp. SD]VFK80230.1 MAG: Rhomboid family protein [Candidatus Kentron sp. SD]